MAFKRPLIPDPRYNSTLVANLVNMIMERGKRIAGPEDRLHCV